MIYSTPCAQLCWGIFFEEITVKLSHVIDELVEERGLDRSILNEIMCEGMLAAYEKRYPEADLDAVYNKKTDEIEIVIHKLVTPSVSNDFREVALKKARAHKPDAEIGEVVALPFDLPIGRIEILKAKQIIAQKIRSIEAATVYNEFKPREGTIVTGTVYKCEHSGAVIKLQDTLAFMPKSLMIPEDKCIVGYTVRALLKEVLPEPRNDVQLILDRSSPEFLSQLFALEIPEVYEGIVRIKKVVRSAGYKAKMIVVSTDENIDPIGTCVGPRGARIKPLLDELVGEKIDVMTVKGSIEDLVKDALRPAEIDRVELIDEKTANVWLAEDQRSLAIGKMGQNIQLASELTGLTINLVKNESQRGGDVDVDAGL